MSLPNPRRRARKFLPFLHETLEQRVLLHASPFAENTAFVADQTVVAAAEPAASLDLNEDGVIDADDAPLLCNVLDDPEIQAQVLVGDANLSGSVGFDDFLAMSAHFGQAGHFGEGDFDCSGTVGFPDFLLMSANFGKSATYELPDEETEEPLDDEEPSDPCEDSNSQCVWPGQEPYFQQIMATPSLDAKTFYIQPGVELERLDIIGRHGDVLHFLPGSKVEGTVKATGPWHPDRGVVNIEASADLLITGLHATNNYQYQLQNVDGDEQSSTALTVSWSDNIELRDSVLKGRGKLTTWIQGDSTVDLTNTEIDCYYFCIGIAASDVTSHDLTLHQYNEVFPSDLHAAMWISSTMRSPDNAFYGDSNVSFTDTTINKRSGEGIIVGNGGYDYRSHVAMKGVTEVNSSGVAASRDDGWLAVHPNYFGITLSLDGDYPVTSGDLARDAAEGDMGRFIVHRYQGTGTGPEEAPLFVCEDGDCVSSLDLEV